VRLENDKREEKEATHTYIHTNQWAVLLLLPPQKTKELRE